VHGEQLVVGLGTDDVIVGCGQLSAHHQGDQPGQKEEDEAGVDVPHTNALVIDR
jgi:hypothetical protein